MNASNVFTLFTFLAYLAFTMMTISPLYAIIGLMIYYRNRQPGYAMAIVMGVSIAITIAWWGIFFYNPYWLWPWVIGQVIFFILFASLTITIDDKYLLLKFGPGIIRKRFELKEIAAASEVRNRWWFGLGINYMFKRWFFNVHGLDAVEIRMKNGRHYRIGTDRHHELKRAIDQAIYEHDPKFYRPA